MNIQIRAAEVRDAEALTRVYSTPRTVWGTFQLPYTTVESRRKRIAELPLGNHLLVAEVDGEVVGSTGLQTYRDNPRRSHVASIGMGVRDDWQGKGIGTALLGAVVDMADRWLQIKRLELEVYTDNPVAIALYTKFGFEREGTLRAFAFRNGEYVDAYVMARVRTS